MNAPVEPAVLAAAANLHPVRAVVLRTALQGLSAGWTRIGGYEFRRDGETLLAKVCWGRCAYEVPVSEDVALAISAGFACFVSRSAGRGARKDIAIRLRAR